LGRIALLLVAAAIVALPTLGCSQSQGNPCTTNAQCLGYDICRKLSGTTSGMCVAPYDCNDASDCAYLGSQHPWLCTNNQCTPVPCLHDSGCD
jgi:hypothetical protein